MSQFWYYLPDCHSVPDGDAGRALLSARGVAHAFEGICPAQTPLRKGPDGAAGLLLCRTAETCRYDPAAQTWRTIPGCDAWLGWEALPSPADLARREPLIGLDVYRMPLGDGRLWQLPTAILPDGDKRGACALPQARDWDDAGNLTRTVKPKYRALYAAADQVWSHYESGEPMDEPREVEIALLALACNYRVGPAEAAALALLDDASLNRIFRALVALDGWPSFRRIVEAAQTGEDD